MNSEAGSIIKAVALRKAEALGAKDFLYPLSLANQPVACVMIGRAGCAGSKVNLWQFLCPIGLK